MDAHELARMITRQVLEHIRKANDRACVLVLAPRDEALATMICAHLEDGADVVFLGEETGGRAPARYILPLLSCADMADLAVGRAGGTVPAEILRLLLSGREVEVLDFEYKAYGDTAPGALYSLYQAYEKTLSGYGVAAFRRKMPEAFRFWGELVTAAAVRQAKEQGVRTLEVPASAVVTPLAADEAGSLNINILKRL